MDELSANHEASIAKLLETYGNGEETVILVPVPEGTPLRTNIPHAHLVAIGGQSNIVYFKVPGKDVPYCCYLPKPDMDRWPE